MKYIRTESGHIYEINERGYFVREDNMSLRFPLRLAEWQTQDSRPYFVDTPDGYTTCIKQSDSIRDLCDAFVNVEIAGGFKGEFHVYKDLELAKHAADEKVTEIYGALRTDKGLIYVAKINDKGELELL